MRRILPFLLLLAACGGGSTVTTNRPTTPTEPGETTSTTTTPPPAPPACEVDVQGNDVTIVRDPQHGYGFSLPPPDSWSLECIEEGARLARGENAEIDAAVTVTRDAASTQGDEVAYLRDYTREVRAGLLGRGAEVTRVRLETLEGAKLGLLEVRSHEDGVAILHVVATSVLRMENGNYLRFLVMLPSQGVFGRNDADPAVQRALRTAFSFGTL